MIDFSYNWFSLFVYFEEGLGISWLPTELHNTNNEFVGEYKSANIVEVREDLKIILKEDFDAASHEHKDRDLVSTWRRPQVNSDASVASLGSITLQSTPSDSESHLLYYMNNSEN